MKYRLPELGSKVMWDDREWKLDDIEMCNGIGVNLSFRDGGRIHYHLTRPGQTARISASSCEIEPV